MSEELVYRERLKATRGQRLRGALSPLQRAHEALVDKVYAGELEGGVLCSEGSARQLPLFRGCVLGTPEEAAGVFEWVAGGTWATRRRPRWTHEDGSEEDDARVAVLEGQKSRLGLCGNLVGLAEAELFFVGGESEPALVLKQLELALEVWRPWALVFVSEERPEELDRLRTLLLGVRALIGEELSAIKLWRPRAGDDAGRFLEEKLWVMAVKRGAKAWRRELLFIDAMLPTPPGELELEEREALMARRVSPRSRRTPPGELELEGREGELFKSAGAWLGQTAVTQGLYRLVTGEQPSGFKGETRPVEQVSWEDGLRLMNQLSVLAGVRPAYAGEDNDAELVSGANGFRLPFEVEWELAGRGGEAHEYAGSNNPDEVGWSQRNSGGETHPVGQLKANGYGCYDFSGNVDEWCADDHDNSGQHRPGAVYRVIRGGGWATMAFECCVSFCWHGGSPGNRDRDLGLRLSRSLD